MPPQPRTVELENEPVEMGESVVEPRPKPAETEPAEVPGNSDAESVSSEALERVTDEEIKSGDVYEKIIPFAIRERGGLEGEVTVDKVFDTRNSAYFNEAGELIDKETGVSGVERTRAWFKGKESEEQIEARVQRLEEINRRLLAEPNTLIPTDDCVVTINGVEIMQAGFAIMNSEKEVSYLNLNITPEEEPNEEEGMPSDEVGFKLETDEVDLRAGLDIGQDLILIPVDETELIEASIEQVWEITDEVSEDILTEFFIESMHQIIVPNTSDSIIGRLAQEFGFTYGTEIQEIASKKMPEPEAESKAIEISEVIVHALPQEMREIIVNEEIKKETIFPVVVESILAKEEIESQTSMLVETATSLVYSSPETQGNDVLDGAVALEAAPIRLILHTEKENIASVFVPHQMREIISDNRSESAGEKTLRVEEVIVSQAIKKEIERGLKPAVAPVAREKYFELDSEETEVQVIQEKQISSEPIEMESEAINNHEFVLVSELTRESAVVDRAASIQSEIKLRAQDSETSVQNEVLEIAKISERIEIPQAEPRIFAQQSKEIQIEEVKSFIQEQETKSMERDVAISNPEEFMPQTVDRFAFRNEGSRTLDQLNSAKSTAPFADDTEPANDNRRTEIIASISNGITMRRIAA